MRCARPTCPRGGAVVVDMGAHLHVVLCLDDGIRALADDTSRRARTLPGLISPDEPVRVFVTHRTRAATSRQLPHTEDTR